MLKWIDKLILYFEEIFLIILFGIMPLLCFFQVLCRYVFHFPAAWTEEAMRAMFVWATFIGASLGVKYGAHLGVTAVVNLFPEKVRNAFQVLIYIVCALFCVFFAYSGAVMVAHQITLGQLLPVTRLPVSWTTASMPVGFTLMSIRFCLNAILQFKNSFLNTSTEREGSV